MARDPTAQVIELAHELGGLPTHAALVAEVVARLPVLFDVDQVFWTRTDFARGTADVVGDPQTPQDMAHLLGALGLSHPAILSYVADPSDLSPRRVSDVASREQWRRSDIYEEGFSSFGPAHQLSLVTSVDPSGVGEGWTMTRSGRDFGDDDVDLASRLLPVLVALGRAMAAGPPTPSGPSGSSAPSGQDDVGLTPRERQVLVLLAEGWTAAAIARRSGITVRTVRKHLESVYAKLGCHDRLVAVARARQLGLIGP